MGCPLPLAVLLLAGLTGCSSLLPRSEARTADTWEDYESASAAIDRIVPQQTTRAELAAQGIDPQRNASITILTFSDVVQRFATGGAIRAEELDPGVRQCLTAGKACNGYSILLRRTVNRRSGNFWLDTFNFKRETDSSGWSFNALILLTGDLVVYTLKGGQPRMHETAVERNPLGPLQGWGEQVPGLLQQY
jgi:hypothetical protein